MELTNKDIRLLYQWMHPEYVISAASEYGDGDPVLGASQAWTEIRNQVKDYIKYIRTTRNLKQKDLKLAQALRAMGFVGVRQHVYPLPDPFEWRRFTTEVWSPGMSATGPLMPGKITIEVEDVSQSVIDYCSVILSSRMLYDIPECNRALLRNKVYSRDSFEIMFNFTIKSKLGIYVPNFIVCDPSNWTIRQLKRNLVRGRKKILEVENHPLKSLGTSVRSAWIKDGGLIASPAGLMITCVGSTGVETGHAPLMTDFNGIPTYLTIGKLVNGNVDISLTADHRVYDGHIAGQIYSYFKENLPKIIREFNK